MAFNLQIPNEESKNQTEVINKGDSKEMINEFKKKEKELKSLLNSLKNINHETVETQEKLYTLINDAGKLETSGRAIASLRAKCSKLEEQLKVSAENFLKFKNETIRLWNTERTILNGMINDQAKSITKIEHELELKDIEISKLKEYITEMKGNCLLDISYNIIVEDPAIDLKEIFQIREEKRKLEHKIRRVETSIKEKDGMIKRLKERMAQFELYSQGTSTETIYELNELNELKKRVLTLNDQIKKGEEIEDNLRKNIADMSMEIENKNKQLNELSLAYKDLEEQVNLMQQQKKMKEELDANVDNFIKEHNEKLEALQSVINEKDKEMLQLQNNRVTLTKRLKKTKIITNDMQFKLNDLRHKTIPTLQQTINDKNLTIQRLENLLKHNEAIKRDYIKLKDLGNGPVNVKSRKRLNSDIRGRMVRTSSELEEFDRKVAVPESQNKRLQYLKSCKPLKHKNHNIRKPIGYNQNNEIVNARNYNFNTEILNNAEQRTPHNQLDLTVNDIINRTIRRGIQNEARVMKYCSDKDNI